jgi:DNA-binding response OmpR family regulator
VTKISLLLVDDDAEYAALLKKVLEKDGLCVSVCQTGRQALDAVLKQSFDLILLDVTMPEMDGFTALQRLRKVGEIPIIMLTARIASADRVQGLDGGADDYICKPCDPDELLSRIRAVLRRSKAAAFAPPVFVFGTHRFDVKARELTSNGVVVRLTSLESELLAMLLQAHGKVVSREAIAMVLQDRALDAFDRSLDVHVSRLRAKLGDDAAAVQTVRGTGYFIGSAVEGS